MSVGVALCDSQRDGAALLRAADEAMSQMKQRRQARIATDLGDGDLVAVVLSSCPRWGRVSPSRFEKRWWF